MPEQIISIIAAVAAVALVVFTIVYNVRKKRKHKGGCCGGDCAHCKGCASVTVKPDESQKSER